MLINKKNLRLISRRFWGAVFALVITFAVIVQLGREAFPLLDDYKIQIENLLSRTFKLDVDVGRFEAHWSGLRPRVEMADVAITGDDGATVVQFSKSVAELGIIASITQWRLHWRELSFQDINIRLIQSIDGSWKLQGYNRASSEEDDGDRYSIQDPLDVLLIGRRVKLLDTFVTLEFANGEEFQVNIPEVSIENDQDFLRVLASAAIDEEAQSFEFVLEGHGNPRNAEKFTPNGYISFKNLPMLDFYTLFANQIGFDDSFALSATDGLSLDLWFRGLPLNGMRFRGSAELNDAQIILEDKTLEFEDVSSALKGRWHLTNGWSFDLQDFNLTLNDASLQNIHANISKKQGKNISIKVDELDASRVNQVVLASQLTGDIKDNESTGYIFNGLQPRGLIKNLQAEIRTPEEGYFFASANVEGGYVNPILGSPGVENLHAYVEFSAFGGRGNIVSDKELKLYFPEVYPAPFDVQEAYGQINWEIDTKKRIAYITTNTVTLKIDSDIARGAVSLTLPFARKYGEQMMTLLIGVDNVQAANLKQFIPTTISPQLYEWLKDSVHDGRITNGEFIYSGSISRDPAAPASIQLYANMFDGNIIFDPLWPELENIEATLLLDNYHLDVDVKQASILDNKVESTKITLAQTATNEPALSIRGKLSSETSSAIQLLQSSPIGEVIGNAFDNWSVSGKVGTSVELIIPLSEDATQAYHKVEASFFDAGVNITDAEIEIKKIKGKLDYHTETGFSSRDLTGQIWEKDFRFDVNSIPGKGIYTDTEIAFSGSTSVQDLIDWIKMPVLMYLDGQTEIDGRVVISGEETPEWPVNIFYQSELDGVTFNLPAPLKKSPDKKQNLKGIVHVGEEDALYEMSLANVLDFYFRDNLEGDDLALVKIGGTIDETDLNTMIPGYFTVSGDVSYYNLDEWIIAGEKFEEYEKLIVVEEEVEEIPFIIDVNVKNLDLDYFNVPDAKVSALLTGEDWDIDIDSQLMKGNILLPATSVPVFDFEYIRLDEIATDQLFGDPNNPELEEEPVTIADMDPFDFSTGELVLHDKAFGFNDLGVWHFKLRIEDNKAIFSDIFADSIGLNLLGEKKDGAVMIWEEREDGPHTSFKAKINTKNVANVLAAMNLEKVATSKSARVNVDLNWNGIPTDLDLENVEGNLSVNMKSGSFVRGVEGDETELLRLLALFNFDTLARRLKLDFSDLASEGFFYDQVKGKFEFKDGKILMSSPVEVTSSTSVMRMAGTIDVVQEEIDAELVVTLPVAGNLATLVGFLGGLPAGVGIYLVSKIFKKQVDRLSSLGYEISGKWEDPKIKIKKVFDDKGAERKADELKERTEVLIE